MIIEEIYNELTSKLSPVIIQKNIDRDGGTAFGYVICVIRDMYNLPKVSGWDTSEAICKYFNMY